MSELFFYIISFVKLIYSFFGFAAGKAAAAKAKEVELGTMNLDHLQAYAEELKAADATAEGVSPMLLPNYARHER